MSRAHQIYIEHNPFICETIFKLDGTEVAENTKVGSYKEQRLQLWIENIFYDFHHLCNKATDFEIIFKGVEADYNDLVAAANASNQHGLNVKVKDYSNQKGPEARLEHLHKLVDKAKSSPVLNNKLTGEIERDIKEAFNKDFDVYVSATMSSGKSTFINGILGFELLPAANEATTATIAEIYDSKKMPLGEFMGQRFNKEGQEVDPKQKLESGILQDWNKRPDTSVIKIEGNIQAVKERSEVRLVLTDTPGPNNSQDDSHRQTTYNKISDTQRNPLLVYILNATQLGINDDKNTLEFIAEQMNKAGKQSKERFIFVVNKMDAFDPERGEDIGQALERVRQYLSNCGIENPKIYPVSAFLGLLSRLSENFGNEKLTRAQRGDLNKFRELFLEEQTMDLTQYMQFSSSVKNQLMQLSDEVLKRSGLPAVEMVIDEYIEKYSLPHRVNRAYTALSNLIKKSSDEEVLQITLADSIKQSDEIAKATKALADKLKKGQKSANFLDDISPSKYKLPKEVEFEVRESRANINETIQKMGKQFREDGKVSVRQAEEKLSILQERCKDFYNRLTGNFSNQMESASKLIEDELKKIYQEKLKELFNNVGDLKLPALQAFESNLSNLSMGAFALGNDDVDVNTYEVSTSKWYNPFSWGRKETRRTESVNLESVWDDREDEIAGMYNQLFNDYTKKLDDNKKTLVEKFTGFMQEEFEKKFEEFQNQIKKAAENKEELEQKAKEAQIKLDEINAFKNELFGILQFSK